MSQDHPDLAAAVLDEFVRSGRINRWQRRFAASGGAGAKASVTDVYEVHLKEGLTEEDKTALQSLLEQHGRTSLSHELEIRFHRRAEGTEP